MQFILLSLLIGYSPLADTLHHQSIVYEVSPVNTYPGTLTLTNQAVHFVAKNSEKQERNFILAYEDIKRVRRRWQYIFPNRTLIQTRDGEKYTLYTYRRKKIIRTIKAHINRKK